MMAMVLLVSCSGGGSLPFSDYLPTFGKSLPPVTDGQYTLGAGDQLQITVFGEPELSGQFAVENDGVISFPLLGDVPAAGLTITGLSQRVSAMLQQGFVNNPQLSISVLNYRPFFILGEVNAPGSFPYESGMRMLNAVALAGGYSYRAKEDDFIIRRGEREYRANETTIVLPGDIIRVQERWF